MKMTKKIFLGAVAVMALALVGCKGLGEGSAKGTKLNKTMTIDATDLGEGLYRRAFIPLSTSKNCSAIDTEVTLSNETSVVANNSVVGMAIDTHKTKGADGNEYFDFILIGVRPVDGKYYVERLENVSVKNLKETMETDQSSIDDNAKATYLDGKVSGTAFCTTSIATKTDDGYGFKISVTQDTAGTYVIALNDAKVAEYTAPAEALNKKGNAVGQVYLYGNAKPGDKIVANYATDKDLTTGLYEEE